MQCRRLYPLFQNTDKLYSPSSSEQVRCMTRYHAIIAAHSLSLRLRLPIYHSWHSAAWCIAINLAG